MSKCYSSDWEGGMYEDNHIYDKEGWCIICGEPTKEALEKLQQEMKDHFKDE